MMMTGLAAAPALDRRRRSEGVDVAAGVAKEHLLVEPRQCVDRLLVLVGAAVFVGGAQRGVQTPLAGRVDEEGGQVAVVDPEVHHRTRNMPTLRSCYTCANAQIRRLSHAR